MLQLLQTDWELLAVWSSVLFSCRAWEVLTGLPAIMLTYFTLTLLLLLLYFYCLYSQFDAVSILGLQAGGCRL